MLGDEPNSGAHATALGQLPADPALELAAPDPDVVDNARHRLAFRSAETGQPGPRELPGASSGDPPGDPADDLRAIRVAISAARGGTDQLADALDVGAGLAILRNLRHYLDRLEADLLDAAVLVSLDWDLIAAITGVPASEVQRRHQALRARRDAQ